MRDLRDSAILSFPLHVAADNIEGDPWLSKSAHLVEPFRAIAKSIDDGEDLFEAVPEQYREDVLSELEGRRDIAESILGGYEHDQETREEYEAEIACLTNGISELQNTGGNS